MDATCGFLTKGVDSCWQSSSTEGFCHHLCLSQIVLKPCIALSIVCLCLASGGSFCMSWKHPLVPGNTSDAGESLYVSNTPYFGVPVTNSSYLSAPRKPMHSPRGALVTLVPDA